MDSNPVFRLPKVEKVEPDPLNLSVNTVVGSNI